MVTLAQLKSLCAPSLAYPWSASPVLRSRDGKPWTAAIARGWVLLAIRGKLTDNIAGPAFTAVTREEMTPPQTVRFAELRKFVNVRRKREFDGAQCIGVCGVPIDAVKLRPILKMVSAETVEIRVSAKREPYGPNKWVCPRHLHISAPDWLITVAAYAAMPKAEFPVPRNGRKVA